MIANKQKVLVKFLIVSSVIISIPSHCKSKSSDSLSYVIKPYYGFFEHSNLFNNNAEMYKFGAGCDIVDEDSAAYHYYHEPSLFSGFNFACGFKKYPGKEAPPIPFIELDLFKQLITPNKQGFTWELRSGIFKKKNTFFSNNDITYGYSGVGIGYNYSPENSEFSIKPKIIMEAIVQTIKPDTLMLPKLNAEYRKVTLQVFKYGFEISGKYKGISLDCSYIGSCAFSSLTITYFTSKLNCLLWKDTPKIDLDNPQKSYYVNELEFYAIYTNDGIEYHKADKHVHLERYKKYFSAFNIGIAAKLSKVEYWWWE